MRKLTTVRQITNITEIPDADAIETAWIGGWPVVVKKNDFSVGDWCVYFEPDSFVPHELAPFLSRGNEPREHQGVQGERLKTIKLRKQLSQGLILPIGSLLGYDLSTALGVIKYEPPVHAYLSGSPRGNFPENIRKTDQERVQNLHRSLEDWKKISSSWTVTEKLDGSSMTMYLMVDFRTEGQPMNFGVCSRNIDLKPTENNYFWSVAQRDNYETLMRSMLSGELTEFALQGELVGPGIQGNPYHLPALEFRLFDIWDIANQEYLPANQVRHLAEQYSIPMVPIIDSEFDMSVHDHHTLIAMADGKSELNPKVIREGLIFELNSNSNITFKAISNAFLLKQK